MRAVYNPIIHAPKKKDNFEQLPLYLEIEPSPIYQPKEEKIEEEKVIIVELF
jgi:hypothetical protein